MQSPSGGKKHLFEGPRAWVAGCSEPVKGSRRGGRGQGHLTFQDSLSMSTLISRETGSQ